jgi:hypothetical protein
MSALDLNQGFDSSKSKISSIKTYIEISKSAKQLQRSAGNSQSESISNLASSLDKISTQQKRYLRQPPTSFDQLLDLIGLANGSGSSTLQYLRKTLLETVVKIEPKIQQIISEEALKALGCSQEQTFQGFSTSTLQLNPLSTLPVGQGIYVPVQSLDIASILKTSIDSKVGKIIYEKPIPNVQDGVFKPYGGKAPFPMNKTLNLRMDGANAGTSFYSEYGKYYQGVSGQNLFDFQYSQTNQYGVNQDCYRVALISGTTANAPTNKVGDFLKDYYGTIKLIDSVDFGASLVNLISGAIDIQSQLGAEDVTNQSQFSLFLQRILGLCFDSKTEIDVSGISKVGELDGVDETFFELTEVDLRNIEIRLTNIQNGVMEFEDCDNVKLPVDYNTLTDGLIKFRDTDGLSTQAQVKELNSILDSIYQNPDWKVFLPTNFNLEVAVNKDIIKQIPLAVASSVLSPKVLFPIFVLLQVVESEAKNTYNQAVTSGNTYIQSGNTIAGGVNNIVNNQVDFMKTFKTFNIQVVSKIGAIFLELLYEILKKDIINLLGTIIKDIVKGKLEKRYATILRLVNIAIAISQLIDDYRKCKSLIDDILILLNLINGLAGGPGIPKPLLLLTKLLPGTSPERSTINTVELLQSVGIPTGTLPDGSPNLMGIYNLMTHRGAEKEKSENGKLDAIGISSGGPVDIYGVSV